MYLDGGIPTPLKNMSWSVGMIIPNIWKIKKIQTTNQVYLYIYTYTVYGDGSKPIIAIFGGINNPLTIYMYVYIYIYISIPKHNCYI